MTIRTTTNTLLATATLLTAAPVLAQDIEPFQAIDPMRFSEVDIEDTVFGIPPYYAENQGLGLWLETGAASDAGSSGEAGQWTRVDADYIGGFVNARTSEWGGARSRSQSNVTVVFEVDRTGFLDAYADFTAIWSDDLGEVTGLVKLDFLNADGQAVDNIFQVDFEGEVGDQDELSWERHQILYPGRYRFELDTTANVRGVEIWPDLGEITGFGSIELGRLPDCGEPGAGSCTVARIVPSCADATCCTQVCEVDPYCCSNAWDDLCADRATATCVRCIGDLNGDGTVDGADQGMLFAAWGPQPPTFVHPADLNSDGIVDGEDFGLLMANWGGC